jgi:creatinine amidohydrolase
MREVLYTIRGPKTMFEMTWEEVGEALKETDMAIVPLGATEQHGPHLPLGTDTMGVVEFARRTAAQLEEEGIKALVAPPVPFGISSYHMPFPGTISLHNTTWRKLVLDVLHSLYTHGFRRFVLPLGHGGNWSMMLVVSQQFMDETEDAKVLVLNWLPVLVADYPEVFPTGKREGHSGAGETSRMLATHPELVQLQRAQVYYPETMEEGEPPDHPLMGGGVLAPKSSMKDATPIGSVGDPNLASAELGDRFYQKGVDWVCGQIKKELGPFEAK